MPTETIEATDRAKEVAAELEVDLADVKGTGKDGTITVDDVRAAAPEKPSSATSWPSRGFRGSQPWESETDDDDELHHDQPILSTGSAGPEVAELAQLLDSLGYENSYTRGENPFSVLDASIMSAVQSFQRDYGVTEDPSAFPGGAEVARNHVGAWTWEALHRAAAAAE